MVLMKQGYHDVAKSYILYREKHKGIREAKKIGINLERLIKDYINNADWKIRENSNEGVHELLRPQRPRLRRGPVELRPQPDLHRARSRRPTTRASSTSTTCPIPSSATAPAGRSRTSSAGASATSPTRSTRARPSTSRRRPCTWSTTSGPCRASSPGPRPSRSVDTLLAPFVRHDNLSYEHVKQDMQKLIFGLNVPSRWGWQTPFSNLTFDWTVPEDMKDKKAVVGGEELDTTYGDYQAEMDMINRAFLELMIEGDHKGRVFTFPIPTYNLTPRFRLGFAQRQAPLRGHGQVRHPVLPELHRHEHEPRRHPGHVLPAQPRPARAHAPAREHLGARRLDRLDRRRHHQPQPGRLRGLRPRTSSSPSSRSS